MNTSLFVRSLLFLALWTAGLAQPALATDVSGDQSGTWALTKSPYVVTSWVTVPAGQTLTIEPGVEVRFNSGQGLSVRGTLAARGMASANITFTSGGTLAASAWNAIYFEDGSSGSVERCRLWYAGNWDGTGLYIRGNAAPTIANCEIAHIGGDGIKISETAKPALTSNTIADITEWPIRLVTWSALPTFQNNTFNTIRKAVRFDNATVPEGQQVTWPHPGYPYSLYSIPIEKNGKLTLPAGLILKFDDGGWIDVRENAVLDARGTAALPIIFTSIRDDSLGGDTYGDATAAAPARSNWNALYFSSGSGTLDYAKVRYAGYWDGTGIKCQGSATPTIANCEIAHISGDGIKISETAKPVLSANNTFADLTAFGVRNNGSSTVNARNNWWGDASGPQHATLNPGGKGYAVSDQVNFQPYLTQKPGTAVTAPTLKLGAASLAFDSTAVGSSSQKTLTLSNTGTATLTLSQISVSGTDAAQFRVTPASASIAPASSATLTLIFAPTSAGAKRASLSLTHNAAGSPTTVALTGAGKQAAAATSLQLSAGSASGGRGTIVAVPISVSSAKDIAGGDLVLSYDSNALAATEVKAENLLTGAGIALVANLDTPGQVKISMAGNTGIASGSGALATLSFEIKTTASAGAKALRLQGTLRGQNGQALATSLVNGSVTVAVAAPVTGLLGDVNGDKAVDSGDAILVLRHATGLATLSAAQRDLGDVNGDGITDAGDAILILRKAAGRLTRFPREGAARLAVDLSGFNPGAVVLRNGSEGAFALDLGPEVWGAELVLRHDPQSRLVQTGAPEGVVVTANPAAPGALHLALAKGTEGLVQLHFRLEGHTQVLRVEGRLFGLQGQAQPFTQALVLPGAFALGSYPNPFNASTVLRYVLEAAGPVRLVIYNAAGTQVRLLVAQPQEPGVYKVVWDGRDEQGANAASGLYLGRLETGGRHQTQKLLLLK